MLLDRSPVDDKAIIKLWQAFLNPVDYLPVFVELSPACRDNFLGAHVHLDGDADAMDIMSSILGVHLLQVAATHGLPLVVCGQILPHPSRLCVCRTVCNGAHGT